MRFRPTWIGLRQGSDLPLSTDASAQYLPWIIGIMVYLAVLALAATMAMGALGSAWRQGLAGSLTVQILPPIEAQPDGAPPAGPPMEERLSAAIELLRATPGVARAEALSAERSLALIEPWIGPAADPADLPLPRLIDVALSAGAEIDLGALAARLEVVVPGAVIDDHALWRDRLGMLALAAEAVGLAGLLLIAIASTGTVVLATRAGLSIHHQAIELLHLVGARDNYVARQFQAQAVRIALIGGIGGLALGVATLAGLFALAARLEAAPLPDIGLDTMQWLALATLPLAAAAIGYVTARVTVTRALARML